MGYKILFVDVDGTLLHGQQQKVSDATVNALQKVQAKGIPVVIATGRSYFAIQPQVLNGFVADYAVCNNGTLLYGKEGDMLFEKPMSLAQIETLITYFTKTEGAALGFSFPDGYYTYVNDQLYRNFYKDYSVDTGFLLNGEDQTRHLSSMPFAAWGMMPHHKAQEFNQREKEVEMLLSIGDNLYDICQTAVNKTTGSGILLNQLGLGWQDAVFIGDGENDIPILQMAGLGIAMGNAADNVKEKADWVTASVAEEGIAFALQTHFNL